MFQAGPFPVSDQGGGSCPCPMCKYPHLESVCLLTKRWGQKHGDRKEHREHGWGQRRPSKQGIGLVTKRQKWCASSVRGGEFGMRRGEARQPVSWEGKRDDLAAELEKGQETCRCSRLQGRELPSCLPNSAVEGNNPQWSVCLSGWDHLYFYSFQELGFMESVGNG